MPLLLADNNYLPFARAMVFAAKKRIYISTFKAEMSRKAVGKELLDFFTLIKSKARAGVTVKLLINWHANRRCVPRTNLMVSQDLKNSGVLVRHLAHNRCCHAKLLIADGVKAIVGSHNLSVRSVKDNFELSILLDDSASLAKLCSVFEYSFQEAVRL